MEVMSDADIGMLPGFGIFVRKPRCRWGLNFPRHTDNRLWSASKLGRV